MITGDEGRVTGHNWMTTKETGEPNHAQNPGGKSVWYKFQAPGSGKVYFDTMGSTVDTVMAVYTGTGVSALTTGSTVVADRAAAGLAAAVGAALQALGGGLDLLELVLDLLERRGRPLPCPSLHSSGGSTCSPASGADRTG